LRRSSGGCARAVCVDGDVCVQLRVDAIDAIEVEIDKLER
jgi:hypothetical protein